MKKKLSIRIDNKAYKVDSGSTILQAAERNDIYIPTLCAHEDLTPFGGCRMCIVEADGVRGLPTACTTPVTDGMVIRTNTTQIQTERSEILKLILSEHTSSCLICDERNDCRESMMTIRKAGVTTGCRFCPNDSQCELQDVVEHIGITEISYPVYYRHLRVEKEDPFYDRDYNLCILCGRCIRMCQEVRTANTLSFKQRGRSSVIGPAFDRTHLEAGCEFCGACVSVCPTGALAEKARKWDGKADSEKTSTCALCGIGCRIRLLVKSGRVIGSLPAEDSVVNNGHLCVKGRFCVNELVNGHDRLKKPYMMRYGARVEITWNEAVESAAEKLAACKPDRFAMLISPNCTSEDLYVAQKFTRVVLGSHNIDTSARSYLGPVFNAYIDLMKMAVPLSDVRKASTILCVGLDTMYSRSVVGVELRKAMRRGAKIVTVNSREHNLSLIADLWIRPEPGGEEAILRSLVKLTGKKTPSQPKVQGREDLREVAEVLHGSDKTVILVGPEALRYNRSQEILEEIARLARNLDAGIIPLPAYCNLFGSILMGAYPELLPGGRSSADGKRLTELCRIWDARIPHFDTSWNAGSLYRRSKRLKVLYLVGEVPTESRPNADSLIYQNIYPMSSLIENDLVLPSTAFTETEGTFINGSGRVQKVVKAVKAPGKALPDWKILCLIARKMGASGFDFSSSRDIQKEISLFVDAYRSPGKAGLHPMPLTCDAVLNTAGRKPVRLAGTEDGGQFVLDLILDENIYRGFSLSGHVDGAAKLFPVDKVVMNPEDAERMHISEGDEVAVRSRGLDGTWPVAVAANQPEGTLRVAVSRIEGAAFGRYAVNVRRIDV